jgi:AcrR family transcriptional regulator
MRLFGEQGYHATSVAQIEEAAGLSPGSGSLYKHFPSKEALLTAGLERLLASNRDLMELLSRPIESEQKSDAHLQRQLEDVAVAGLRRMHQDRDLNRLLYRGLDAFPTLMARFRDEEIARVHAMTAGLLKQFAEWRGVSEDWDAVATVLVGAVAHYAMLEDLFATHPSGIGERRFVAAAARLAAALLRA